MYPLVWVDVSPASKIASRAIVCLFGPAVPVSMWTWHFNLALNLWHNPLYEHSWQTLSDLWRYLESVYRQRCSSKSNVKFEHLPRPKDQVSWIIFQTWWSSHHLPFQLRMHPVQLSGQWMTLDRVIQESFPDSAFSVHAQTVPRPRKSCTQVRTLCERRVNWLLTEWMICAWMRSHRGKAAAGTQ